MRPRWPLFPAAVLALASNAAAQATPPSPPHAAPTPATQPSATLPGRSDAPAGITALGSVIIVNGCLRGTDLGNENAAFTLDVAAPAEALTDEQPPQGVSAYRVVGIVPDLRRHVGERVEVIGLIREAAPTDGSAPLTLDAKSVVATDKCSR